MNNRSFKVGLASALGALIGSLIALQLNPYLWWIGLIVGGGVGYLSYEFKTVIQAITIAWQIVIHWQPNWAWWKQAGKVFIYTNVFFLTITTPISILFSVMALIDNKLEFLSAILFAGGWSIGPALFLGVYLALVLDYLEEKETYQGIRLLAIKFNPIKVYFYYAPKYSFIWLWFAIKHIPWFMLKISQGFAKFCLFVWTVFKFIHSEERVMCAFYATVGTGIGYICRNALIGMLVGGIFGVLNYEIWSKRILKLLPVKEIKN